MHLISNNVAIWNATIRWFSVINKLRQTMPGKHLLNLNFITTSLKDCSNAFRIHGFMMFSPNSHWAIGRMLLETLFIESHNHLKIIDCPILLLLCELETYSFVNCVNKDIWTGFRVLHHRFSVRRTVPFDRDHLRLPLITMSCNLLRSRFSVGFCKLDTFRSAKAVFIRWLPRVPHWADSNV